MALTRKRKEETVAALTDRIARAKSLAVLSPGRLKVAEVTKFRRHIKEVGGEFVVAKKTLFRIAVRQAGLPEFPGGSPPGQTAYVMSYADEVSAPKAVAAFQRAHPDMTFLGGFVGGCVADAKRIADLAAMRSRPEALARFASLLRSPLMSFALLCRSPLTSFARGLQEVAKKKPTAAS